eukprot:XP_011681113.1 PREDICTED: uncharacterized protein LOC754287 isoform X1 [Strongylocentrotus purpuratus]
MGKRKSSQSRVARQPKIARPRQSTRLRQSSNDTTQDVLGTSTPRRAGRPKRARHSSGNPSSGRSATTSINPAPETDGPQYSGNETTGANQSSSQPPSHAQPMQDGAIPQTSTRSTRPTKSYTYGNSADLAAETHRLLGQSLAEGSQRAYQSAVDSFQEFRLNRQLNTSWPTTTTQVMAFIAHLSINGKSSSTITKHVAALSYLHNMYSWADPTKHFLIKKMQEGSRRDRSMVDSRRPITWELLETIIPTLYLVCYSHYESMMFHASYLLAFLGFLRVGEFTIQRKGDDLNKVIARDDIKFCSGPKGSLLVRIRFSKTDQYGQGTTINIGSNGTDEKCPVKAMKAYLRVRPDIDGPLFCHRDGAPVTRYQFSSVLKKTLQHNGYSGSQYGTHSFRIGAATTAALKGVPPEQIMAMGRWRSSVYMRYIR